ncbi:MAG: hypothetical protein ACTSXQ_02120 [Alphaproteobacteria bacterium]
MLEGHIVNTNTAEINPILDLSVRWPRLYDEFQKEFSKVYKDSEAFALLAKDIVRTGILDNINADAVDSLYDFFQIKYKELSTMPMMTRMAQEKIIKESLGQVDEKDLRIVLRELREADKSLFEKLKNAVRRANKKTSTSYDVRQVINIMAQVNDILPTRAEEA